MEHRENTSPSRGISPIDLKYEVLSKDVNVVRKKRYALCPEPFAIERSEISWIPNLKIFMNGSSSAA